MENLILKHQKSSDAIWLDETGNQTQYARLYKHEKLMEKSAISIAKNALAINAKLVEFKNNIAELCDEVYAQYLEDKQVEKIGKGKGNFTWFNFDRSIKIEMSINERITFDEMGITTCKELLNKFLDENIESKDNIIKEMVNDAFNTSRGKLDAKKVMNLLRYESKVKNEIFQQAMNILKDSIRRPSSKAYYRVSCKDNTGEYQNVELNFSAI
jgi:hypothetical protein